MARSNGCSEGLKSFMILAEERKLAPNLSLMVGRHISSEASES